MMDPDEPSSQVEPVVIKLEGEIDVARVSIEQRLATAAQQAETGLVIDLIDVTFIDSSFVRSLVLAYRSVTARGGWLRIVYTHHVIKRVIDLCGLTELFPQYPTVEAACRDHLVGIAVRDGDDPDNSPRGSLS